MSYSPEQVEAMADNLVGYMNTPAAPMLRAYAATLRQQAGRVDEAGYVFLCSNPACRAVHIRDPHGPCHVCLAGNGGGWSTTRQRLYRNGPDRYSTEEEGEAYMEGWFDGQAALAQNTQGDGEAVAEIGMYWDLRYFGNEPISKIVERTGAKIGDKLYLHAERARVPDGMVLVPREPTPEMLAAVEGATCSVRVAEDDSAEYPLSEDECAEIYRNMLAAAPSQRAEVK